MCFLFQIPVYMLYMNRSMTIMVLKALRRSVHKVFSLPRMKWLKKHQLLTIITVLATLSMLQVIMEIKFLKPRKASSVHISSVGNQCVDVHLAVGASGIYQRKRLAIMIKSILLYSSRVMLHLHLLVDNINKHRIDIFLSTWNLTQVVPHYYENDGLVQDFNSLAQIAGYLFRNKHLLRNISKMAANVKSIPTSPPQRIYGGLMILSFRIATLQPLCHNATFLFTGEHSMHRAAYIGCRNTSKELDKLNNNDFLVTLDIDIKSDLPLHVLDVHSNSIENGVITQIDKSDGDLFREIMPSCARKYDSIVTWEYGYEPYVVVPTGKFLYDEILLERMRDKLTYTFSIAHKGCSGVLYRRIINEKKFTEKNLTLSG
ncbi:hypothetical protein LSH36_566g00065 [Paralvinella palmiformis]|uniref:Uncharacterized protein n=1 Tax=Paralvinella palmiformis TaxID=53620 RepID=A0AAD9MWX4_9ANNE|nr:hypothetical protein LSH36_566g00065 [Paralvinella palmiformis]